MTSRIVLYASGFALGTLFGAMLMLQVVMR